MSAEEKAKSKRPEDSDFKQQRLPACQPLLTPPWVIGTFIAVAIVFIPIGAVIIAASNNVIEVRQRYDNLCTTNTSLSASGTCDVTLKIEKDMTGPLYFYYELTNYYQNHRRYVKSRSDAQLRGSLSEGLSNCDPLGYNGDNVLVPCGLIANSFFNDTFSAQLCDGNGNNCYALAASNRTWLKDGIAWKSDRDSKFTFDSALPSGTTRLTSQGVMLPNITDEDFIVWMRTAGLPTFKKLYRKIENLDLKAGTTLRVTVLSRYPVDSFSGEKAIVVSMTSWLGGKNTFLGYAYIVVGALCLALAALFWAKHAHSPRRLGDMSFFHFSSAGAVRQDLADE